MKETGMKKIVLSLLCVVFARGAFGAASAGDGVGSAGGVKTFDQRLTLVFCSNESYRLQLEGVFVRGVMAKMEYSDDSLRSEFRSNHKYICTGICLGERTVGCILSSANCIKWIVIDPEEQGKGLACQALDMFACQKNLDCICLNPANRKLENFYRKCGFEASQEAIEYRNAIEQESFMYIPVPLVKYYKL